MPAESDNRARAEGAAQAILGHYGLEAIRGDLDAVAFDQGLVIQTAPLRHAHAQLVAYPGGRLGIATVSDAITNDHRRKFAGAHEFGHWVLHRGLHQNWICTEADLKDYQKTPHEIEANCFAAELQLPARYIRENGCRASLADACRLRHRFDVSLTAACRKLMETLEADAAMVWVENGEIRYYVPSRRWSGPKLRPRFRPGDDTLAQRMRFAPVEFTPEWNPRMTWETTADQWSVDGDPGRRLIEEIEQLDAGPKRPTLVVLRPA